MIKDRPGDEAKTGLPGATLARDLGAAMEKIMELALQNESFKISSNVLHHS